MELVKVSKLEGRIAVVALNNPPVNVLNIKIMKELSTVMRKLNNDKEINSILIKGDGKCFSAGADVREHFPEMVDSMLETFKNVLLEIFKSSKVTVASVHGFVFGGGFELTLATDFCIAAGNSRFSLPEIKLGVFPPAATAWLPVMIGYRNANKLFLTGCELDARTLRNMGLINHVVGAEKLDQFSIDFCGKFSDLSMVALEHAKASLSGYRSLLIRGLEDSVKEYTEQLMKKNDPIEGLTSFTEKRKAVWKHS